MPYVIKIAALFDLEPGQEIEIAERHFYGGDTIDVGDEAFLWYSGPIKRLAWLSEVIATDPPANRRVRVFVRLISRATPGALTTAQLEDFRAVDDASAFTRLRRQLYAQAHNKITEISNEDATVLRQYFNVCA